MKQLQIEKELLLFNTEQKIIQIIEYWGVMSLDINALTIKCQKIKGLECKLLGWGDS